MTDGEKKRIREVMDRFARSSAMHPAGSPLKSAYTAIFMALNWAGEFRATSDKPFLALVEHIQKFGIPLAPNTGGEKGRIRNMLELFVVASTKVPAESPQGLLYNSISLALDWAIEETVIRGKLFEGLIDQIKACGVTFDPNLN